MSPRNVRATGLLILLVLIGACGSPTEPVEDLAFRSDPTILTVWAWEGAVDDSIIAEFERLNPNIEVDIAISGFDQHHVGLRATFDQGGEVPDVALVETNYLPGFLAHPEDFIDLAQFGANDVATNYLDWRWEQGVARDDAVIGLPTDVGGIALAYRRDLFEAAGLPSDPETIAEMWTTWDGFIDTGRTFAANMTTSLFLDSPESVFYARLGQADLTYVDADGTPVEGLPAVETAFTTAAATLEEGLAVELRQFSPEWNDAMVNGDFAVLAAPSWMRNYLADIAPETAGLWALAPVPGVAGNWGGSQVTIPAGAEHSEAAWELARFMTSTPRQQDLFNRQGNFPSTPALYTEQAIEQLADPFFGNQLVGQLYIASLLDVPTAPTAARQRDLNLTVIDHLYVLTDGTTATAASAWILARNTAAEMLAE